MTGQRCPSCGADLPPELGQHALTPTSGLVECPTCGATVTLERPQTVDPGDPDPDAAGGEVVGESTGPETFSGSETVAGVMDEVRQKEDE